jgi:SapC
MSAQLLIYKNVTPLSKDRHAEWSVEVGRDFGFARDINALPILVSEFAPAAREYPIVFSKVEQTVQPLLVVGMRDGENLYLDGSNQWSADYVPAFLRRYPFVFSRSNDGKTFTLCIDEAYAGFNQKGLGQRIFSDEGVITPYVKNVMQFLQTFQAEHDRTQALGRKLDEFELLETHNAVWTAPSGEKTALSGFYCINRKKLQELPPKVLTGMIGSGEMDLIYAHLLSLTNFQGIKNKMASLGPV